MTIPALPSLVRAGALLLALCPLLPAQEEGSGAEEPVPEPAAAEQPAAEERPPAGRYLAVTGATVHTITDGTLLEATVLCKDGRILKVGREVAVPEGAEVIDARGMHVYPGLIAVNASGIAPGGQRLQDNLDPFSRNLGLALAGGLTCVQEGGVVARLSWGRLEGTLAAILPWVNLSYSTTNPSNRRRLRASLGRAREYLRQVRAHELAKARGEKDLEEPSDKGLDKNHLALLKGEKVARFSAHSMKDLLGICDLLEAFPMRAVIFGGREAWTVADRLGRSGAFLVIEPRSKQWPDEERNAPSGWSIENARILYEAGVPFALLPAMGGYGSGQHIDLGGIAGRDLQTLPMEAAFAMRGGLPQEAALRAITLDAARILGVEDLLGSLEPGKYADLIVTDGDLLDYRTFVQWAVVDGRVVYDKQEMPWFAHIRPRPAPRLEEVAQELLEELAEPEEDAESRDPDAPEGDG